MRKKIIFLSLLIFTFVLFISYDNVFAVAQMECEYESENFVTLCGDGGCGTKTKITIKLEANKFSLISAVDSEGIDYKKYFTFGSISVVTKQNENYIRVTDPDKYTSFFIENQKYACPKQLTLLQDTKDATNIGAFVTNSSFDTTICSNNELSDFSCEHYDIISLTKQVSSMPYLGGEIVQSSGNCCLYKNGSTTLYSYLITSPTGATQYASCLGNNCMVSDPNQSNTATFMNDSIWRRYQSISNCGNMPTQLYYSVSNSSGKINFYPNETSGAYAATIDLTTTCSVPSSIYSTDGIVTSTPTPTRTPTSDSSEVTGAAEGCAALGDLLGDIQFVWDLIKIAAPILVILFGSIDYAQAVLSGDNDALKKATKRFIKRLIAAVALFFLPLLIELLFEKANIEGSICGIK